MKRAGLNVAEAQGAERVGQITNGVPIEGADENAVGVDVALLDQHPNPVDQGGRFAGAGDGKHGGGTRSVLRNGTLL
jgi:hypothetical protein